MAPGGTLLLAVLLHDSPPAAPCRRYSLFLFVFAYNAVILCQYYGCCDTPGDPLIYAGKARGYNGASSLLTDGQ